MEIMKVKLERCKQCYLCAQHCPNEAITFSEVLNTAGYNYACVNDEICIRCGICYIMCPDGVYSIVKNPSENGDQQNG